ncbi:MAG: tetratricopeptide repeat protein, partial [Deltaproteobacteria bacterium]|nr:tetratricopeptide repeat protein [Deltaproteobacteria bacterium]
EVARGSLPLRAFRGIPDEALAAVRVLGHQLAEAGRDDDARAVFAGLVALDPRDAYARTALATLCLRAGDALGAEAHLRTVLRDRPTDRAALVRLGAALLGQGRLDEAKKVLRLTR